MKFLEKSQCGNIMQTYYEVTGRDGVGEEVGAEGESKSCKRRKKAEKNEEK